MRRRDAEAAQPNAANRSLAEQFDHRRVQKKYILLTDRRPAFGELRARSALVRVGAKYVRPDATSPHFEDCRLRDYQVRTSCRNAKSSLNTCYG